MRKHKFKAIAHTHGGKLSEDMFECEGCGMQVDSVQLKEYKNDYCPWKKINNSVRLGV